MNDLIEMLESLMDDAAATADDAELLRMKYAMRELTMAVEFRLTAVRERTKGLIACADQGERISDRRVQEARDWLTYQPES